MNLPTYMKCAGEPLPEASEPARFIVAENGIFLERRTPMFKTSTRVNRFDLNLACHNEYCRLNCGRIPRVMHRVMLGFFRFIRQIGVFT